MERLTPDKNSEEVLAMCDGYIDQKKYDKLTAYEATGLSPAEVAKLAQAKKEGRLVVCAVPLGSSIFRIVCRESCFSYSSGYREASYFVREGKFRPGDNADFGKTVFSTCEEAKAALENML